jgi:hypothetical protein
MACRLRCSRLRQLTLALGGVGLVSTAGVAQPVNLPPAKHDSIIIGGARAPSLERCVDVQIGDAKSFGCLNEKLQREVEKVVPNLNLPPMDARSADVRVGNVNEAAVRQQYGSNYGRSAVPFRPPAPVYFVPRN